MASDHCVLLSGFPGFRARKMAEQLLASDAPESLVLLIHHEQRDQAEGALERLPAAAIERVELISGDPAAIDLGLSGVEYRQLVRRVVRFHHVTQGMYPDLSADAANRANVGAMREALEFSRQCRNLEVLVAHSSAKVSGDHTGVFCEADLNVGQRFPSPVEETLAIAELMARRAMGELPIVVIRPTQIVGDSRTGEVDRFDGPYLWMLLLLNSPDFPVLLPTRGDIAMNLVPIDFVVKASDVLSRDRRAYGRTFHLTDPDPLSVRRVFELVASSGGSKLQSAFIPDQLSRALVNTPGLQALAKKPRSFINTITTPVRYDMRNTEELLAPEQVSCPPFESYVDALVDYVRQRQRDRDEEARSA